MNNTSHYKIQKEIWKNPRELLKNISLKDMITTFSNLPYFDISYSSFRIDSNQIEYPLQYNRSIDNFIKISYDTEELYCLVEVKPDPNKISEGLRELDTYSSHIVDFILKQPKKENTNVGVLKILILPWPISDADFQICYSKQTIPIAFVEYANKITFIPAPGVYDLKEILKV